MVMDTSGQVGDGGHFGKAGHTVRQDSVVNGTYGGTYAHMAAHGGTFCFKYLLSNVISMEIPRRD